MSNPRIPDNVKELRGTNRKDRAASALGLGLDFEPVAEVPEPPDWLPNHFAISEWHRVAPILISQKLLTDASTTALGHMCALHGKLCQLWTADMVPNASVMAQYRALVNEFGLTPAASAKMRTAADAPKENAFLKHGPGKLR